MDGHVEGLGTIRHEMRKTSQGLERGRFATLEVGPEPGPPRGALLCLDCVVEDPPHAEVPGQLLLGLKDRVIEPASLPGICPRRPQGRFIGLPVRGHGFQPGASKHSPVVQDVQEVSGIEGHPKGAPGPLYAVRFAGKLGHVRDRLPRPQKGRERRRERLCRRHADHAVPG